MQTIPIWGKPIELPNWPTQAIENAALHYHLCLPSDWKCSPKVLSTDLDVEHFFRGKFAGEGLIVKFMEKANPNDKIQNWVDAFISLIGFPILSIQQTLENPPQLLEWQYEGTCSPLSQKLKVDETHLYEGLAQIDEPCSSLIRLYTLLARRNTLAWQINLSISSACLADSSEELVKVNDGVRAGAILGNLQLL